MQKSKPKYLFAGLGTMGFPMAGHLSRDPNLDVYVFNRTSSVSAKWVKKYNGTQLIDLNSCSVKFDGLITCLKDDDSISSVILKSGFLEFLKTNSFILDHSTTSLDLVSAISQHPKILAKKISFFDAPVSGGEAGAVNGALSIMLGGAAQSWQMDNRFKTMVNAKFDFGFAVDLMIKDLNIALDHSKDLGIKLPSTKSVLQNYKKLSTLGDGQLDTSSLIKLLEK
ncbi:NAD(P)-dependent oxidoreductase [Gammaproteobacteria bacterium]|nr:NAD(P)-dependent oxidoreductase [Gammaproteobacteria bacterium]